MYLIEHINNDWREEMKKLLVAFGVLLVMSGCGNGTETLSCSNTSTANGVKTKTMYDIEYKDDDVKHIKITYDYSQDQTTASNGTNNGTTGNNTNNGTTTNDNTRTGDTTRNNNNTMDGVDTDTDGLDRNNTSNNDSIDSDDVVDGVVGDTIDGAINGVTDTILDLAGIKRTYENQMNTYNNIEGFSYKVDTDDDDRYKVIYEIDMDKISDDDLTRFNVTRDFSDIRKNYEDLGYTCK